MSCVEKETFTVLKRSKRAAVPAKRCQEMQSGPRAVIS